MASAQHLDLVGRREPQVRVVARSSNKSQNVALVQEDAEMRPIFKKSSARPPKSTTSQLLVWFAISIVALAMVAATAQVGAVCPNANEIKPCTCDDEGLQCLKLNNSGLMRIFQTDAERKAIRRVWIFQTNLTELKQSSFGDYIIRDLYLDLNQIDRIEPGAFGEATKTLQSLSLTRNLLTTFPFEDLKSMKKLKQLGLGHNRLVRIESRALPSSDTIESIDLSHNLIETIEPFAFAELTEVSLIDLSRNKLRTIGSNALTVKAPDGFLSISLRNNQISSLASDAFGTSHPNSIDLSRNNLTYLDQYTFESLLSNNTTIFVEENPFTCDSCELFRWLLELNKSALDNIINFVCKDDTKLEDLTLELIGCSETN